MLEARSYPMVPMMLTELNSELMLTCGNGKSIYIKGNLAHRFMDVYFLCLSFLLDISNSKEMEKKWKY